MSTSVASVLIRKILQFYIGYPLNSHEFTKASNDNSVKDIFCTAQYCCRKMLSSHFGRSGDELVSLFCIDRLCMFVCLFLWVDSRLCFVCHPSAAL